MNKFFLLILFSNFLFSENQSFFTKSKIPIKDTSDQEIIKVDSIGESGDLRIIRGSVDLCMNYTVCLEIDPVFGATEYSWSLLAFNISQNENQACYIFTDTLRRKVSVLPKNETNLGRKVVLWITPKASRLQHSISRPICIYTEIPTYVDEFKISQDTFFIKTIRDSVLCDSTISYRIRALTTPIINLDTVFCEHETFRIKGHSFNKPGKHEIKIPSIDESICDTLLRLNLTELREKETLNIESFYDSFLNTFSFQWERNLGIKSYEIKINGISFGIQNHSSFLYPLSDKNERVEIEVIPIHNLNCLTLPVKKTVFRPMSELRIIPNPSFGEFYVYSNEEIERVSIYDSYGHLVLISKSYEVNLSHFPIGVYFFKIETQNERMIKKVIKL